MRNERTGAHVGGYCSLFLTGPLRDEQDIPAGDEAHMSINLKRKRFVTKQLDIMERTSRRWSRRVTSLHLAQAELLTMAAQQLSFVLSATRRVAAPELRLNRRPEFTGAVHAL